MAFEIEEGQQTMVENVEVTGNKNVAETQLTAPKGFQLRAGGPFSPRKLAEDRNRISATYLNRGYLNAEVKATVTPNAGDPHRVNVAYAITEHQLVRISEVVYLGQKQTRLPLIEKTAKIRTEDADAAGTVAGSREPAVRPGHFRLVQRGSAKTDHRRRRMRLRW